MKRLLSIDELPIFYKPPLDRLKEREIEKSAKNVETKQSILNSSTKTCDEYFKKLKNDICALNNAEVAVFDRKEVESNKTVNNLEKQIVEGSITTNSSFSAYNNVTSVKHRKKQLRVKSKIAEKKDSILKEDSLKSFKNDQEKDEFISVSPFNKSKFNFNCNYKHKKQHRKSKESYLNNAKMYLSDDTLFKKDKIISGLDYTYLISNAGASNKSFEISKIKQNVGKKDEFSTEIPVEYDSTEKPSNSVINQKRKFKKPKKSYLNPVEIDIPDKQDYVFKEGEPNKCTDITYEKYKSKRNNLDISETLLVHKPEVSFKKQKKEKINFDVIEDNFLFDKNKNTEDNNFNAIETQTLFDMSEYKHKRKHKKNKEDNLKTVENCNISDSFERVIMKNIKKHIKMIEKGMLNIHNTKTSESGNHTEADIKMHALEDYTLFDNPEISFSDKHKRKCKRNINSRFSTLEANIFDCNDGTVDENIRESSRKKSALHTAETNVVSTEYINSGCKYKHGVEKTEDKTSCNENYSDFTNTETSLKKQKKKKRRRKIKSHAMVNDAKYFEHEMISTDINEGETSYVNIVETFDKQNVSLEHGLKQHNNKNDSYPTEIDPTLFNKYQVKSSGKWKKKHKNITHWNTTAILDDFNNTEIVKNMQKSPSDNIKTSTKIEKVQVISDYKKEKRYEKDKNWNLNSDKVAFSPKKYKNEIKLPKNDSDILKSSADKDERETWVNVKCKNKNIESHFMSDNINEFSAVKKKHKKKIKKSKERSFNCDLSNTFSTTLNLNVLNKDLDEQPASITLNDDFENYQNSFNVTHTKGKELTIKKKKKQKKEKGNYFCVDEVCESQTNLMVSDKHRNKNKEQKKVKGEALYYELSNDYPSISRLNKIIDDKEDIDSTVLKNDFMNNRNSVYKNHIGERALMLKKKKKHKKEKRHNLRIGEVQGNDSSKLELHERENSDTNNSILTINNDIELNSSEDTNNNLTNNILSFSPINSPKKGNKKITNDIHKDVSHSESYSADNDSHKPRKKCVKNSLSTSNNNGNAYDFQHDSYIPKVTQILDFSNVSNKNATDEQNFESSSDEGVEDSDSGILDYEEDPIDFETPPLHRFEKVCALTQKQKNDLLAAGISIKGGRYTISEDNIIKRNLKNFATKYGISDPVKLLGIGRYKRDHNLLKFLKAKHFYMRLAKDLNDRELSSVYRRARMIFDPYRNACKFTKNEIVRLKELHKSTSKWYEISKTLGKSAASCVDIYKWHGKDVTKGKFTETEKTQLVDAIKKVTGNSDFSCKNMKGISWERIASYVPTRNYVQCRTYWADHLAWKPGSAKEKWNHSCFCKLVHILKEMNVENSSMIDWYKIYESFEDFAPSDIYVQKKWLYLRSRIPNYKNKSYREIVDLLCNKYLLPHETDI